VTEQDRLVLGAWSQGPDQEGLDIEVATPLTAEEFDKYLEAIQAYHSVADRPIYELLHRSWHRLTSMRDVYANIERLGGQFRIVDKRIVSVSFAGEVLTWQPYRASILKASAT
jgi:hypothetical protein